MDVAFHALAGSIGCAALIAQGQELGAMGFVVGSVFPDLDVLFMAGGERFYLRCHQGPTHAVASAPVTAAVLTALLVPALGWQWPIFIGLLAGLGGHVLLDVFNTLGVRLLWPFSNRRFRLDAVFFVDSVSWVLTAGCSSLVFFKLASAETVAIGYASFLGAYLIGKLVLQRFVRHQTQVDYAIPSAANPFAFFLFSCRDGWLRTAKYDALHGYLTCEHMQREASTEVQAMAEQSTVFREMRMILRSLQITRVDETPVGITMTAEDLAVRNFGGKFGRTELTFDTEGRVVHEVAHI